MTAVVTSVVPDRFRAGDIITVTGFGFSPDFGVNRVSVELIVSVFIVSESDTVIVCEVPAGIPTNQQVSVIASRNDTQDASEPFNCWSLGTSGELGSYGDDMPGQVPGPREAAHLDVDVPDVGQAIDYERQAAHALRIADEILEQQGDIFTSDGTNPERQPIGGGGLELHSRPAEALGLRWEQATRWLALRYGAELTGDAVAQFPYPNGSAFTGGGITEHGAPFPGTITRVSLHVHFSSGAAIDRVRILVGGVSVYDSGAGQNVLAGETFVGLLSADVQQGDLLEIETTQDGADGNPFNVTGSIMLKERGFDVLVGDTLAITDSVSAVKTGAQARSAADLATVTDTIEAGLS